MSRPNRPRSIASEANLARRISFERDSREWSYERLAQEMTAAGCAIQGSAIYKIEKGSPPRRVTVDELVALATVFERDINDLLTPMEIIERDAAKALADDLRAALDELQRTAVHSADVYVDFLLLAKDSADLAEYVKNRVFPNLHTVEDPDEPDEPSPPGADLLIRGIVELNNAVISASEVRVRAMLDPDSPEHAYAVAATSWYRALYGDEATQESD